MPTPHLYAAHPPLPAASAGKCATCHVRHTCLPSCIADKDELMQLLGRRIRIARDGTPFHFGSPVGNRFYAVQRGTFKTILGAPGGNETITSFQMSGDFLAMEDADLERHSCTAIALEDSEVCEILCRDLPSTISPFHRLLSKQLVRQQNMAQLLRKSSADRRIASFLLELSWRFYSRGYSARRFRLAMSRQDIGSYLALSPECISRWLFQFKREGLLQLSERDVTLLEIPALRLLAQGESVAVQPRLAAP